MPSPDWLAEGGSVLDPDEERWVIRSIGANWIELGHPDQGRHRLRRSDLVEWVERGEWSTTN